MSMKMLLFPLNVTSLWQPMNQHVIETMKGKYQHKILTSLVKVFNEGGNMTENVKKNKPKRCYLLDSLDEIRQKMLFTG
jgi:hypothetical protein